MNQDTVVISSPAADEEVRDYVARVRRALADLPTDDVEELTLGMEADLGEIRSEGGPLATRLGPPEDYAAELRAAAGLPPRAAATRRGGPHALAGRLRARYERESARHAWVRATAQYLVTLRPAWWLLRAFIAAWVLTFVLGGSGLTTFILTAVFAPLSVLLGQRRPRLSIAARRVILGLNALGAAATFLFFCQFFVGLPGHVPSAVLAAAPVTAPPEPLPGLSYNGSPLTTLYVYDEHGQPVHRARLLGPDGRSLDVDEAIAGPETPRSSDIYGREYTNVYPVPAPGEDPWHPATRVDDPAAWTPPATQPPLAPLSPLAPGPSAATTTVTATPTSTSTATATATTTATPMPGTTSPTRTPAATATVTRTATATATASPTTPTAPTSTGTVTPIPAPTP